MQDKSKAKALAQGFHLAIWRGEILNKSSEVARSLAPWLRLTAPRSCWAPQLGVFLASSRNHMHCK